jgi:hypothetical protein
VACGSPNNAVASNDFCIVQAKDGKAKICYGMTRIDAEKVVGQGKKIGMLYQYDNGIGIIYNEEAIVNITMTETSKGKYMTASGGEMGMLKEKFKKAYEGKPTLIDDNKKLSYAYSTVEKKYLEKVNYLEMTGEQKQKIYTVNITFNESGYAEGIVLSDLTLGLSSTK